LHPVSLGATREPKGYTPAKTIVHGLLVLIEELLVAPGARGRVYLVDVDAAAMPLALRGGEGADIGEERCWAVGSRLCFGMSSPQ
jgi:hypothetical protein